MSSELEKKIYDELETRILNHTYRPDKVLTEQGIAKEFNVSRTPVREVFQRLLANGLLSRDSARGLCVHSFTRKDMLDIYDLRIRMEGMSAKLCALNRDGEVTDKLKEIVLLQDFYLQQENAEKLWELDNLFHETIHAGAKNRLLKKMLDDFHHYTKYLRRDFYDIKGRSEHSIQEHRSIVKAIQEHDCEEAEQTMACHITKGRDYILSVGY